MHCLYFILLGWDEVGWRDGMIVRVSSLFASDGVHFSLSPPLLFLQRPHSRFKSGYTTTRRAKIHHAPPPPSSSSSSNRAFQQLFFFWSSLPFTSRFRRSGDATNQYPESERLSDWRTEREARDFLNA